MQLKRYRGKEVPEVMRQVRGDLGDDAVILHTREARPWGPLRFLGGARVEVLAAVDLRSKSGGATPLLPDTPHRSSSAPRAERDSIPTSREGRRADPVGDDTAAAVRGLAAVHGLAAEVAELRAMLIHFGAARLLHPSVAPYQRRLIAAGVDESVAFGLVRSLPEPTPGDTPTPERLRAALEGTIVATLRTSADALPEAGVLAFVGPSGSGKTTTLAKIAGQAALAGRTTTVISTDGDRLGAAGQLEAFCAIAGIDCHFALTPEALGRAVQRHGAGDLVVIDTPGLAVRDVAGLGRLRSLVAAGRPASVHLVLAAPTKAADSLAAVRAFADVGVTHLLFTRMDETVTAGSLITIAAAADLPLSYTGTGPDVPADIQPASARELARRVLGGETRS